MEELGSHSGIFLGEEMVVTWHQVWIVAGEGVGWVENLPVELLK